MQHIHGGDVYTNETKVDFSANINPCGPTPFMIESLTKCLHLVGNYPDVQCMKLRLGIAKKEQVPLEYVTCGNGAADIIFSLVLACKPKKALIIAPTFAEYEQALTTVNCQVEFYELKEEEDFQLTSRYLEYLTEELDMIFLCSPNNPVGNTISKDLLIRILKRCEEKHIMFVLDECFVDFLNDYADQTMTAYLEKYSQLFILKAFTKMHAIPGVRLGYGLSGDLKVIKKLERMRQPWNVSLIAQEAGLAALEECDFEEMTRTYIKEQRTYLKKEFKRIKVQFYEPEANFIFLKSKYDLYELLKNRGILIRDCSNYRGLAKGYYRIAVKKKEQNETLIQTIEALYLQEEIKGGGKDGKANYDIGNHVKCR
ncbi:MAG: histidinol-phosphate transaminase [Lachnospiraceae bacterium]